MIDTILTLIALVVLASVGSRLLLRLLQKMYRS